MWPNPQEAVDLVLFTKEILNGILHFFVQCTFNLRPVFQWGNVMEYFEKKDIFWRITKQSEKM